MTTTTGKLTLDEYRELEATSEIRHAYHDGEIIDMPGGSDNHNNLTIDLIIALSLVLQDTEFQINGSDLRVWIPECNFATYPDVIVVRGDKVFNRDRNDEILNPTLIAEVLSPSTSNYDRGEKFAAYRTIPSFCEYLLIAQDRPAIEHYFKISDGRWELREIDGLEAVIELQHLPVQLPLEQIYRRVRFAS